MAGKSRSKEIDCMRGTAILMVMLYHSVIVFPINLHEIRWCLDLHTFLWVLQMPLFFLVSGYCFSFFEKGESYGTYFLKKCKRILVPHLFFSAIEILPRVIPNPYVHEQKELGEVLSDFVYYGGSDWFLRVLFMIVIVFPILARLLGRNARATLAVSFLLWAVKTYLPGHFLIDMAANYMLFFAIGWNLRLEGNRIRDLTIGLKTILAGALAVAGFFALYLVTENRYAELCCVLCSFPLFYGLAMRCGGLVSAPLTECGRWSLQMYLFDAYAVVFTRTILVSFLGITNPIAIILGNFIPDVCIVYLVSKYIAGRIDPVRFLCGIPKGN